MTADLKAMYLVNDFETIMDSTTKRIKVLEDRMEVNRDVLKKTERDLGDMIKDIEGVLAE